jgi:hypothetical protein
VVCTRHCSARSTLSLAGAQEPFLDTVLADYCALPLRPRYIKVCIRHSMMMVLCKYKKEAPPRTLGVTLGDQRPAAERGARASKRVSLSRTTDANGAHYCCCRRRCRRGSLTCDLLQMSNRSHYYYYYHCVAPWKIRQIRLRERCQSEQQEGLGII